MCHPGQCPSPIKKCSKKLITCFEFPSLFLKSVATICVVIRCGCQNLKKEWQCQQVQASYHSSGRDPKDASKNQYDFGLLLCNSDCKSKAKVDNTDLHLRKSKAPEVQVGRQFPCIKVGTKAG